MKERSATVLGTTGRLLACAYIVGGLVLAVATAVCVLVAVWHVVQGILWGVWWALR